MVYFRISPKLKQIFTFERIFILILIIAFIIRFWQLDLKLLHSDEAVHSWFSYQLLTKGTWVYDPSYHGPFLYFVTAGMFAVLGASDLVARLLPALFGFLLIPLVYCIYRIGYINRNQTLLASLFLAISPDMVYFSRFLRHDIFMLFFTFLVVVALIYYFERGQSRFAIIAAIAAAGGLCTKEEMPVILIVFAIFFIYSIRIGWVTLPSQWKKDLIMGILLVIALVSSLYTGFGGHPETLIGQHFQLAVQGIHFEVNTTGWYQAVDHWVSMSNEQRLGGPWFYYIPLYLLYELPIFFLAMIGTLQVLFSCIRPARFVKSAKNWWSTRRFALSTGDLAAATIGQFRSDTINGNKSELFFRFCVFWMLLTMVFYAYVGEKVPWLLIHQLLPMSFVAGYRLNWQKMVIALVGCIFLVTMTWHVAFIPLDINEPIVQVQTSQDMREVMQLMDTSDYVVIASQDYWPLPWYFRGDRWDKITLYSTVPAEKTLTGNHPGVIILHDTDSLPLIGGYDKKTYKLDYWFSYYDNSDRLISYYLHRDGNLGSINIDVFTPHNAGK